MTLTKRLLLLALISVLPAIVIWTYTEVSLRRAREAEVADLALRQARLASSEIERIFDGIESLLIAVDEVPSIRSFNTPVCNAYIEGLKKRVPHLLSIIAIDNEGHVRCGPVEAVPGQRFDNRPYVQVAMERNRFAVGEYRAGFPEGNVTQHPVLPLALPIHDDAGRTVGVLAAALDLRWLGAQLNKRLLPQGGSITIADRKGIVIAREPLPESFVGTKIPDDFSKYINDTQPGTFEAVSRDGVKRIIGYIPINQSSVGLYISAGLSSKAAFDMINQAAKRGFMLIAAALVLALSLSWLISRTFITKPFEAMTGAVRSWRRGNYQARINLPGSPGELGLLAQAFNDLMDDVVERQKALQASEERARLALDAGQMGTWWYDHVKKVGGWSSQAAVLLGLPPEQREIAIWEWRDLIHPEDLERVLEKLRAAVRSDGDYEDEYRIRRPNGQVRWINSKGRIFLDSERRPAYFVGVFHDITERRQAEDQQRFFLDELNHRVKNTLATVQSIATQTLRSAPSIESFRESFEGRLLALSKTHDVLTRNAWREANLREIAEQELAPYRRNQDDRILIEGPEVNLPSRYAINFGLVLHEFVTNAAKYGALSTPSGRIELTWSLSGGTLGPLRLNLRWKEIGGPPVAPPRHQGFGSKLVNRSIEGELSGTVQIDFAPTGVSYDITVPLPCSEGHGEAAKPESQLPISPEHARAS